MNLGTQLKWFHDFWTPTPVAKIPQSLIQKLNYKSNSKLLKRENLLPDGPTAWPKLHTMRARTSGPSDMAHNRGSLRALTKLQKSPRAKPKLLNLKSTTTPSQPPCKNTPLKTCLYNQVVPDTPPHAGAALADTGQLRRLEEDFYHDLRGRHSPTERRAMMGGGSENGDEIGRLLHGSGNLHGVAPPFQ
jgi:hypothetical protein